MYAGTGTGGTTTLLDAGTAAALQVTGAFTIEFQLQVNTLGGAQFLCAQANATPGRRPAGHVT